MPIAPWSVQILLQLENEKPPEQTYNYRLVVRLFLSHFQVFSPVS